MGRLRRYLPLLVVVILSTYCLWSFNLAVSTRSGVGVSRDDAPSLRLPADARNINYYVRAPASFYDFDTTEAGFIEFVANWGLPWMDKHEGAGGATVWNHATNARDDVRIDNGVFYGWWKDDAQRMLAFDRKTGRAYCSGWYR